VSVRSPDPTDKQIGTLIRAHRISQRMSQTALAQGLGVTFQQVQKYERGTNRVGSGRLKKIAERLGVPITTFFKDPGPSDPPDEVWAMMQDRYAVELLKVFVPLTPEQKRAVIDAIVLLTHSPPRLAKKAGARRHASAS
jgi:transcriptional regulator with XRE-family HTH domain